MSPNKVEMSLDDIIKTDRKNGKQGKKGGIRKKPGQTKLGKKKIGGQKKTGGNTTAATKALVQKLVKKALAQKAGNNQQGRRGVRTIVRKGGNQQFRGVNQRSRIIKKGPRTETVIVRKVVQAPRPQPRQQIIREVVVQEPVRRQFVQSSRRFNNNSRPKIVYVQQQRGPQRFRQQQQQRPRFQRPQPRRNAPIYEPANFLQRF